LLGFRIGIRKEEGRDVRQCIHEGKIWSRGTVNRVDNVNIIVNNHM
jgi:hypothetical protein